MLLATLIFAVRRAWTYNNYCSTTRSFNKISQVGLNRFSDEHYDIRSNDDAAPNAHAILLRSHKLQEEEVPLSVRAIARCGAGTNK